MRISLDLDGVLCDFSRVAIATIRQLGIVKLPADYVHNTWSFKDIITEQQWTEVFSYMLRCNNLWLKLPALTDNVDALVSYIERNGDAELCYITARPASHGAAVQVQTQLWLSEQGLGLIGANVFVVESSLQKRQIIEENGIQFSLDDLPQTIAICQDIPNHRAFVLDKPYNKEAYNLPRIYSVAEFLLEVESSS